MTSIVEGESVAVGNGGDSERRRDERKRHALEDTSNIGRSNVRSPVKKKKTVTESAAHDPNKVSVIKKKTKKRKEGDVLDLPISSRSSEPQHDGKLDLTKLTSAFNRLLPQEGIIDIDHKQDVLNNCSYTNEIIKYLLDKELKYTFTTDYLTDGEDPEEVTPSFRAILVDWLIQVQAHLYLREETLQLCIELSDRFMSQVKVVLADLQLVGVTCLLIASKFHERNVPEIRELTHLTEDTYTRENVILMERKILAEFQFDIAMPVALDFLPRFIAATRIEGQQLEQMEHICWYLLDLSLTSLECAHMKPSMLAAGSVYLTRVIQIEEREPDTDVLILRHRVVRKSPPKVRSRVKSEPLHEEFWDPTMIHYTTYSEEQLQPAMMCLAKLITEAKDSKYKGAYDKHSCQRRSEISTWEPLVTLCRKILLKHL